MKAKKFTLTDVTLRDGLQAETLTLTTEQKADLFLGLSQLGYDRLEITSFVNPKWVPQLADSESFCEKVFSLKPSIETMAFVPNRKGFERMRRFDIAWVSTFIAASEEFNRRNVNQTIEETLIEIQALAQEVRRAGRKIRIYVSTAFGCPYQGPTQDTTLENIFASVAKISPDEVSLSDTIGVATPNDIARVVKIAGNHFPIHALNLHLHDTYGMGLANVSRALELGIQSFDGSTGGIGGCPYAKGATGNLAMESVAYLLGRMGLRPSLAAEKFKVVIEKMRTSGLSPESPLVLILSKKGTLYGC